MAELEKLLCTDSKVESLKKINAIIDNTGGDFNNKITNCITEIPQRIKLELTDGTLTLKAGSEVIEPNGVGVFEYIPIANDLNVSASGTASNNNVIVYYYNNSLRYTTVGKSGATEDTSDGLFYNTTENRVRRYAPGLAHDGTSLPIAILTMTNGVFTSIDQVFNGMGYIGSTIWLDKGVKGLIPNGRNEDGTLNNKYYEVSKLTTVEYPAISDNILAFVNSGQETIGTCARLVESETEPTENYLLWYIPSKNELLHRGSGAVFKRNSALILGNFSSIVERITSFQPKLPFRAVDQNDFNSTPHITETYVNGASGYIVYSNGLCEQWGATTNSGTSSATVTLIKPYKDTNYNVLATKNSSDGKNPNNAASWNINTKTVSSFLYSQGDSNGKGCNWRTIGYIA